MLLMLSGCAAAPQVDLDDAQAWLEQVQSEESDGPGAAGTLSMLIDREAADADGETTLDFSTPTPLTRADARCFGGGTADVTITLFSAAGAETDRFTGQIACNRDVHDIDLESTSASALEITAHGSARTYLHVTVIQEMVVER